jgi:ubiquinone/menaquinone biosynthesis C-methylase UbiE
MPQRAADAHWEAFAAREPYFAVLASPRFLTARRTREDEQAFFDSGRALVNHVFTLIEERLAPDFAPTSILEYGCGVGRLAFPLAERAARRGGSVLAVDRSDAMLLTARAHAAARAVANVEFAPAAALPGDRRFDFISCYFVLQRMPQADGLALLSDLVRRLVPGGIAVVSVPYEETGSIAIRVSRKLRARSALVNGLINRLRGKAADAPYFPTYAYEMSAVLGVIQRAFPLTMNVVLEPQDGLRSALLIVEAPLPTLSARRQHQPAPTSNRTGAGIEAAVDVRDVIARTPLEALNRSAEEYFSTLTDREHQLTKPFSQPHEMPTLLAGMAAVLDGLQLFVGATVVEFGAGTGWLSRCLTQLGCRVILLDVSASALAIARELYERLPVIGDRPSPEFLLFDGQRIDLPDGSVDRILCFHAFHHAPDPAAMVREFGRVLGPGGIAGFAEPGPNHSKAPFSQFEMRTYQVVENDVDVHQLWAVARDSGFSRIDLALFQSPPLRVSLAEFEDFLAGGDTTASWVAEARVFLRNTRTFFLTRAGTPPADSRRAERLACAITATLTRAADGSAVVEAAVTNAGAAIWLPSDAQWGGVSLGAHLYRDDGSLMQFDFVVQVLSDPPRAIVPGETVRCRMAIPAPPPGRYIVELDCVAAQVAWFAPLGSRAVRLPLEAPESEAC